MAKASEDDINLSMEIAQIVEDLEKGIRPALVFGDDDEGFWLDMDSTADLRAVVEKLIEIARRGSIFRVVFGMAVLLDPRNELVDPDADTLEVHPKFEDLHRQVDALERDASRLDFLDRNLAMKMGWHVGRELAGNLSVRSVIQPSRPTDIREAIDRAMPAPLPGTSPTSQGEALPDQP